jgi:hypothetical protein
MHRSIVLVLAVLPVLTGLCGRADGQGRASPPRGKGFTDVTMESGVARLVAQKYDKNPKWWLSGLHLVDLDGDGKLDLFLSAHGGGGALAALNDGAGRFSPAPGKYPSTEIHLAYDADEDGKVDLTMTFQDGGGKWWLNRGKPGLLAFEGTRIERGTNTARRQAMIDLDRDGKVDWLRGAPGRIIVERGDGKGGFVVARAIPVGDSGRAEVLCLPIDIDGDGLIDLLVEWGHYGSPPSNSRIFRNDGKMTFTDVTKKCGLVLTGISIKGAGDVNRDGFPDLFVLENKVPQIYLNDGKGRFTKKAGALRGMDKATRPAYASWGLAVVVDLDNDGIADILWNGRNFLWVLRGTGDGNFEYMNKKWGIKDTSAASVDDGLCFGDIDGDGALDIIGYTSIDNQRRVAVYRNDLPGQHWLKVRPIGRPGNRGAAGAKIRLTEPGTGELLRHEQVAIYDSQAAASYYSYAVTERHFGLGQRQEVDVSVAFYPSGVRVHKRVRANTTVEIVEPAPKQEQP